MKLWSKIAVGAVAVLVIGAAVWRGWPSKEPVYKGKGVREYFYDLDSGGYREQEAAEALQFFGTKSVPYVRAALRVRKDRTEWVVGPAAPWFERRVRKANRERYVGLYAYWCILEKDYWRDAREACAPEVRALMNDPDPLVSRAARKVLEEINTKGKRGVMP